MRPQQVRAGQLVGVGAAPSAIGDILEDIMPLMMMMMVFMMIIPMMKGMTGAMAETSK